VAVAVAALGVPVRGRVPVVQAQAV
jgi:hypothetical protein